MATLSELVRQEELENLTTDIASSLPPGVMPHRELYATRNIENFYRNVLPQNTEPWDQGYALTPADQMDIALEEYVSGQQFGSPRVIRGVKHWRELSRGVWYLKTYDLRLFGWFVEMDKFILAQAAIKTIIQNHNLYANVVNEVVRLREQLDLDDPKFVPGNREEHVISFR